MNMLRTENAIKVDCERNDFYRSAERVITNMVHKDFFNYLSDWSPDRWRQSYASRMQLKPA